MALSARARTVAAGTLVACIAVATLPPPPDPVETRFGRSRELAPAQRRVLILQSELAHARRRLREVESRGRRTAAFIAAARPGRQPVLVADVDFPPAVRAVIAERVAAVWAQLGAPAPDVGVVVALSTFGRVTQTLPPATGGTACIAEVPIGWRVRWLRLSSEAPSRTAEIDDWLIDAIGPCGFYGVFGRPGPHIERWLMARSFDLGWTSWTAAEPPRPALSEALWRRLIPIGWSGDDRYDASLDAVACNAGVLHRCRAALFDARPRDARADRPLAPGVVTRSWFTVSSLYGADRYLADLVRDAGHERFAAFWRSPLPVAEAFAQAMPGAATIEEWTARWQRERMGHLAVGPVIRWPSILLGGLAAVACVGVVALWSRRRQVA